MTALLIWVVKVLVACLVGYIVTYIINAFVPIPPAIKNILVMVIWAIVAILCIIWLIPIVGALDGSLGLSQAANVLLA